jgi:hypothetical protein
MVASFSSRGPYLFAPELLKPDVIAPGVNILAAWPGPKNAPPASPSYRGWRHVHGLPARRRRHGADQEETR